MTFTVAFLLQQSHERPCSFSLCDSTLTKMVGLEFINQFFIYLCLALSGVAMALPPLEYNSG